MTMLGLTLSVNAFAEKKCNQWTNGDGVASCTGADCAGPHPGQCKDGSISCLCGGAIIVPKGQETKK